MAYLQGACEADKLLTPSAGERMSLVIWRSTDARLANAPGMLPCEGAARYGQSH